MRNINRREFVIGAAAAAVIAPSIARAAPPVDASLNWPRLLAVVLRSKHGVAIDHVREPESRLVDNAQFRQLHVTAIAVPRNELLSFRSGHIFVLAKRIADCGKRIRFVRLVIPSKGIDHGQRLENADVSMRFLTVYDIASDRILARLDVLFESMG
jgi:hypothetical protein